jgi:hypothetical protein
VYAYSAHPVYEFVRFTIACLNEGNGSKLWKNHVPVSGLQQNTADSYKNCVGALIALWEQHHKVHSDGMPADVENNREYYFPSDGSDYVAEAEKKSRYKQAVSMFAVANLKESKNEPKQDNSKIIEMLQKIYMQMGSTHSNKITRP